MTVWIALIDDDGEMDAQPFPTDAEAMEYCAGLVLDYISQGDGLDDDDGEGGSWVTRIMEGAVALDRYNEAVSFLNDNAIEDLGVMILERNMKEG